MSKKKNLSRRAFLAGTSAAAAGAMSACSFGVTPTSFRPDPIKIGLVGGGGRGTGAAWQCMTASENVEITALADLFPDKLEMSLQQLERHDNYNIDDEQCFTGFDGYKKLLETDVDVVLLATPPVFRPMMFEAAVEAGKHVFMEKPVGVDAVGLNRILETAKKAEAEKLSVVVGLQYRYHEQYRETVKRIHDGAIGDIITARAISNSGPNRIVSRKEGWSDMEFQIRDWFYFIWASGDVMPEFHVHMIDVVNWAVGELPVKCVGIGGRQVYPDLEKYGNVYDHFGVDYEYPNGLHMHSMTRRWNRTPGLVTAEIVGTKGVACPCKGTITGENAWQYEGKNTKLNHAYEAEHAHLISSIRKGEPVNDAPRGVEATLTAIMGREACYTGKNMTWDEAVKCDLDMTPKEYAFGERGVAPIPVPGKKRDITPVKATEGEK